MRQVYLSRKEPGRAILIHDPGSGAKPAALMFAISAALTVLFFIPNWLVGLWLGLPIGAAVGILVFIRSREGKAIVVDQGAGEIYVDRGIELSPSAHRVPFRDLDSLQLVSHKLAGMTMGWEVRLVARKGESVALNPPSLGLLPFRALSEEEARFLAERLTEALGGPWAYRTEGPGRIRLQPRG